MKTIRSLTASLKVSRVARISPCALLLAAACSSPAQPKDDATGAAPRAAATIAAGPRIAFALPRGGASSVSIQTLPYAACSLHGEGPGGDEAITVFSDDEGVARFELRHADPTVDHTTMVLDCKDEAGHTASHTIDVTVSDDALAQAPAPLDRAGKPTLPPLDVDPMSLTDQEIMARGYPRRPDPQRAPAQFARWLQIVNSGATLVTPHRLADPNPRAHGTTKPTAVKASAQSNAQSNGTWSGYVIQTQAPAKQYDEVEGTLTIPSIHTSSTHPAKNNSEYSSLWVGLDGFGTDNVVQDGIQANASNSNGVVSTSTFAWTEWYPYNTSTTGLGGFPVKAGDSLFAETYVEPSSFGPSTAWSRTTFWGETGTSIIAFGTQLGDVNGDGKQDAVAFDGNSTWVMLSNGSSFGAPTEWSSTFFEGELNPYTTTLADVNGDGKADAIALDGNSVWVMLSNGSSFGASTAWSRTSFYPAQPTSVIANGLQMGDVNGDGKADVVAFNGSTTSVMLSTGSSFGAPAQWSSSFFEGELNPYTTALADVNGDGKADAVALDGNSVWVMLSNGSSFGPSTAWTHTSFYPAQPTSVIANGLQMGDVNGDGMADVVAFDGSTTSVMLSSGSSFGAPTQWASGLFEGELNPYTTALGDVNGDGRADAVAFDGNSTWVMLVQTTGYFFLYNQTENYASSTLTSAQPPNTIFTGHQAEWIMEWPGFNAGDGLADYASTSIIDAYAYDWQGGFHDALSDTSTQLWMYEGSTVLSEATTGSSYGVYFNWENWN